MAAIPDVTTYYEQDGYFDKDEQGWCATLIAISQEGARVSIRRWHDANGILRSDEKWQGTIGEQQGDRVTLLLDGGGTFTFDLKARRLVG